VPCRGACKRNLTIGIHFFDRFAWQERLEQPLEALNVSGYVRSSNTGGYGHYLFPYMWTIVNRRQGGI